MSPAMRPTTIHARTVMAAPPSAGDLAPCSVIQHRTSQLLTPAIAPTKTARLTTLQQPGSVAPRARTGCSRRARGNVPLQGAPIRVSQTHVSRISRTRTDAPAEVEQRGAGRSSAVRVATAAARAGSFLGVMVVVAPGLYACGGPRAPAGSPLEAPDLGSDGGAASLSSGEPLVISVGGRDRTILIHLPQDSEGPLPLVINLHGSRFTAGQQET